MADHLLEDRPARLQIGAGLIEARLPRRAPGLCLGDVGLRHFADVEAIPRSLQLGVEKGQVALVEANDCLVTHDIAVCRYSIEQYLLFDVP